MIKFSEAHKIFLIHFFRQMLFVNSILLPLIVNYGLSDSDYFFLNSIFLFILVLSEIPTGIFSDKFGAKKKYCY